LRCVIAHDFFYVKLQFKFELISAVTCMVAMKTLPAALVTPDFESAVTKPAFSR